MAKQRTASELNRKLKQIVDNGSKSVYTKDAQQALSSKDTQDKRTAITEYEKWTKS